MHSLSASLSWRTSQMNHPLSPDVFKRPVSKSSPDSADLHVLSALKPAKKIKRKAGRK